MNRCNTFATLAFALVSLALGDDSDIIDLSKFDVSSFKEEIAKHDTILVEFFAPWCGHCKRLAPEYSRAASVLKTNDPPVPLAKVDCTSDEGKDVCGEYGVSGYPTLKIFKGGEFSQEYGGPRDGEGIIKYMKSQVGPASKLYNSFAALRDKLKSLKDVLVVAVLKSESDDLAKKFHKAADRLRETVNFAHVYMNSVEGDISDLELLKETKLSPPTVVLVRPPAMNNKFESANVIYDDDKPLNDWINANFHGLVGNRGQSNMQDFKAPYIVAYYDVDYVKNPKGTNYWRNRILKVAQSYKDATFAVSNSQLFAGELEEYGLEPSKEGRDAPPIVVARDKDGKKYVMKEKFSVDALESFVKDFVAGKLAPFVKSEELPADNSGPVKVAVGKNFEELVTKTEKDVLIEFYAPWCGHCKKLAPTYEELGTALKDEPNIAIVKMDATANDVPQPFVVHGFPTIYYYPADTKEPKKYEGGRDVKDFIEFLAKYSTKEMEGYSRDGQKREKGKTEL